MLGLIPGTIFQVIAATSRTLHGCFTCVRALSSLILPFCSLSSILKVEAPQSCPPCRTTTPSVNMAYPPRLWSPVHPKPLQWRPWWHHGPFWLPGLKTYYYLWRNAESGLLPSRVIHIDTKLCHMPHVWHSILITMSSVSTCPNTEQKMDTMQLFLPTIPIFLLSQKFTHW